MTTEKKVEKAKDTINWTPVVVGGTVIAGGIILYKILQTIAGGSEADRELAREIMVDWQQEFDQLQPYMESIYYGGRVPTEQELAIVSAMLSQMEIKERTIYELSKSVFTEFQDMAAGVAASLWLVSKSVALLVLTGAGLFVTYKIWKEWKNRRRPPPNYPCPICGAVYSTAEALKHHVGAQHPVTLAYAIQAQVEFGKATTWVQNAVAVEYFYSKTYTNWSRFSLSDLSTLNWNVIATGVYGIGSLWLLTRVSFWLCGIPI